MELRTANENEWKKGIYPTDEFLMDSIRNKELYVLLSESNYMASMILNHKCTDGYEKIHWNITATPQEITVVHALGVLPDYQGQGIAKLMVQEAIRTAKENGQKAVRLDVLSTNIPAQKLYSDMGFNYMDTIQLFYEDTGSTDYLLYEYTL